MIQVSFKIIAFQGIFKNPTKVDEISLLRLKYYDYFSIYGGAINTVVPVVESNKRGR